MVGGLILPVNPYDGHSLKRVLDQVRSFCGQRIEVVKVDCGYLCHNHNETESARFISRGR